LQFRAVAEDKNIWLDQGASVAQIIQGIHIKGGYDGHAAMLGQLSVQLSEKPSGRYLMFISRRTHGILNTANPLKALFHKVRNGFAVIFRN
jgi:hypothetical protein